MNIILGNPDCLAAIAQDFIKHYETRIAEGATVKGKAMFVCSSRSIVFDFYKQVIKLRPQWAEVLASEAGTELSEKEKK